MEIPDSEAMESMTDLTITLWLYLTQDSTGQWRTVFHKGSKDFERTPTLFLEPLTRGIEFFVSTTDASQAAGERIWSNSFIPMHRWTHIAAVAEGHTLRLYVNGMLDSENTTVGTTISNRGSMYVGGDPWRAGMQGNLDELRVFARALSTDEIQAAASFALGGVEPSFLEMGCMSCSLDNAMAACRRGMHLCNQRDLYSGGYAGARAMGWATSTTKVWSTEDKDNPANAAAATTATMTLAEVGDKVMGLGLCCLDSE